MTTKFYRNCTGLLAALGVILFWCAMFGGCNPAKGATCAFIVENNTSRATIGADTVIADEIAARLGYAIRFFDIDSLAAAPATYNSAYFDTFKIVISVGGEVAYPTPDAYMDTINNASVPWITLSANNWNEIQLGSNGGHDCCRQTENTGIGLNLTPSHWITRRNLDTLDLYRYAATTIYALAFPDSLHDIIPLIIDKDSRTDTAYVWVCIADSNVEVINTGTPIPATTRDRRAFFGLFSASTLQSSFDSCMVFSLFLRTVAWAAKDTLNDGIMERFCFSGKRELSDSWSGGSEPAGTYNAYPAYQTEYEGWDYDEKISFFAIDSAALQRKCINEYRSVTVATMGLRLRYKAVGVEYPPSGDSAWACAITHRLSRKKININDNSASNVSSPTNPLPCYYWAGFDTVGGIHTGDTLLWTSLKGKNTSSDVYPDYLDSILFTFADRVTNVDKYFTWHIPTNYADSILMFHRWNTGFASHVLYTNQDGLTPPGVELLFQSISPSTDTKTNLPLITVDLSAYSTTEPVPVIVVDPDSIGVSGSVDGTIPGGAIYISNSSGGAMTFGVTDDSTWFQIVGGDYSAPGYIQYIYNYGARPAGTYKDTIRVTCAEASNTPVNIPVIMTLTSAPSTATAIKRTGLRK